MAGFSQCGSPSVSGTSGIVANVRFPEYSYSVLLSAVVFAADIVIIDGDPLADILDLANVAVVIQGGRVVVDNR